MTKTKQTDHGTETTTAATDTSEPASHANLKEGKSPQTSSGVKNSTRRWSSYLWSQTKEYVPRGVDAMKRWNSKVVAPRLQAGYKKSYDKVRDKVNDPEFRKSVREKTEAGMHRTSDTFSKYTPRLVERLSAGSRNVASKAGYGASRLASSKALSGWLKRTRNFTLLIVFGGMFMYGLGKSLPEVIATQYDERRKRYQRTQEEVSDADDSSQASSFPKITIPSISKLYGQKTGNEIPESEHSSNSWTEWVFGKEQDAQSSSNANSSSWLPWKNDREIRSPNSTQNKTWYDWIRGR